MTVSYVQSIISYFGGMLAYCFRPLGFPGNSKDLKLGLEMEWSFSVLPWHTYLEVPGGPKCVATLFHSFATLGHSDLLFWAT